MSFYNELRRRNVFRVAIAYLAGAWLLIEVAGTLFPAFGVPDWGVRFVVIVLALGFLPALIISWAYELTPEGLKREKDVVRDTSITHVTAKRLDWITIGLIVVALAFILADRLWLSPGFVEQSATPVEVVTDNMQTTEPEPKNSLNSIAVLPFVNMSSDPEQEYFSDGISEEILNRMIHLNGIRVISRNSSFAYKDSQLDIQDIGRLLSADYILQGSVRRANNVVRISVRLTDASNGTEIWVNSYDKELTNILKVQDEIALSSIKEFAPSITFQSSIERNIDPKAYELYLRGNDYFNRGLGDPSVVLAAEFYEQALELDPTFLLSHVGLAKAHSRIVFQGIDRTQKRRDQARNSIEMALQLDKGHPAVLAAQGWYYYWVVSDFGEALKYFEPALAQLPNDSELLLGLGLAERRLAYWDNALGHLLLSFELDPLSNEKAIEVGISYAFKHDYVAAVAYLQKAIKLGPDQFRSYAHLAETLIGRDGVLDRALQTLRKGGDVIGSNEFIRRMLSPQSAWATQMLILSAFPEEFEELELKSLTRDQAIIYLVLSAEQYKRESRPDSKRAAAETLLKLAGDESDSFSQWVGLAYAHLGQKEESNRLLAIQPESVYGDARTYQQHVMRAAYGKLLLGNDDAAIENLDHALSVPGVYSIATILVSPLWQDLRYHANFQSLLNKYEH